MSSKFIVFYSNILLTFINDRVILMVEVNHIVSINKMIKSIMDELEKANNRIHALEKHNHRLQLEAQRYFEYLMNSEQEVDRLYELLNEIELILEEKGYIDVIDTLKELKKENQR